ncbi:mechanosensitive ion channel family protein [Mesonia sp. HuA40]|uniref:mechanosensitive ion channel family protein n=1 Tax=Mesonia sp. HuA40 TaxID=2602761 RepID=UPI0011C7E401|nr:mechanosensitive ion channel domain-containing protein [Mesonia sp. HuA40]TXK73270.1 mechanosensitive ion channel [Mesonia sp. HuA40]
MEITEFENYAKEYIDKIIDFLPNLLAAIVILIIGWWLSKVIVKYVRKILSKKDYGIALEQFLTKIIEYTLKILVFITAINQIGIETTSIIAVIGAATLAIGLALQGSLANFAGGVIIVILKPFRIGDWIEAQGVSGSVKEISLFYTKINTFGNQLVTVPNGPLANDNITNYTVEGKRKDAITIGISYDADIKQAKDILENLMLEQENIMRDPAPQVVVTELADNSVNLSLRFWALNEHFWDCHWYTIEEAKRRLDAAEIGIPYPQRDVHIISKPE